MAGLRLSTGGTTVYQIPGRTYGDNENLYISLFLLAVFGPIYYQGTAVVPRNSMAREKRKCEDNE